jgi:hypothetical protein
MKCSEFKSESELNISNSMIQGLHIVPYDVPLVLMTRVLGDIPLLGITVGPHELATTPTVLRHFLWTQLNIQAKLEQLKLSKTDASIWLTHSMQGLK